jgi:hypothetical protein
LVGVGAEVHGNADAEVSRQSMLEAWSSMANARDTSHFNGVKAKLMVFLNQQVEVEHDEVTMPDFRRLLPTTLNMMSDLAALCAHPPWHLSTHLVASG